MKRTALVALLLMLAAGCSKAQAPAPAVPPAQPVQKVTGVTLEAAPGAGAPGEQITLRLTVPDPAQIKATMADGSFVAHLCFNGCGRAGRWTGISFTRVPGAQGSFAAAYSIPLTLPIAANDGPVPTPKGTYAITLACILDQSKGCVEHPEATAQFEVNAEAAALAWESISLAGAQPLPKLGSFGQQSTFGGTTVECKSGALTPGDPAGPPELIVTDANGSSRIIPLSKAPVRGRHGYAGCRAVAADPTRRDSLYFAESDSPAEVNSRPLFTRDGGVTWAEIPEPDGFTGFIGFQEDAAGITAWFANDQIRGSRTTDGGATWQTVELTYPPGDLCAWQVRAQVNPPYREGLLFSADGGKSWEWAAALGGPIGTRRFYVRGATVAAVGAYIGDGGVVPAPLLQSTDGGKTWTWVELPAPPDGWERPTAGEPDVRLNSDGSLTLGWAMLNAWYVLPAGAGAWSPTAAPK